MSAFVQSVVLREKPLHEVNPALASQHSDLNHRYFIAYLSSGHAKTVEYGHFEGGTTGTIRIHDGAQTIHATLEAHEFEIGDGKGYEWSKFEDWIQHHSGYQNSPWTRDHHSETFIADCLEHLLGHTTRPEHITAAHANSKIEVHDATPEAEEIIHKVKHDVIHKFHELHKADTVHHTHMFDKAAHLEAYKLKKFGTRKVEYGTIYFGKVDIGNKQFLH
ncbi:hypothetical protein HDU98_003031, partial [Podochytrium sp. JEL0797]